ncbi:unnamed protein product, partial [Rotaria magnacalcarata]
MHANLTIGGGPQMHIKTSSPGGGICSRNISSLIKPFEYFHS